MKNTQNGIKPLKRTFEIFPKNMFYCDKQFLKNFQSNYLFLCLSQDVPALLKNKLNFKNIHFKNKYTHIKYYSITT